MKKYNLILSFFSFFLFSCSDDSLERTIFIPDEENRSLPAYTEWGYNSFGAKYERDYFLASQRVVPCKIIYSNGELQFSLHGKVGNTEDMTLLFVFPFRQIYDFKDLLHLRDVEIDFPGEDCTVKMFRNNVESTLDVINGTLHFKRTQLLSIDERENRVILSGIFNLRFMYNGFPTNMSDGRFDLGINDEVLYIN